MNHDHSSGAAPRPPQARPVRRNLDIGALRSLLAIDALGGMTAAAEQLNLTQSAVSMQIKRLEEALGLRLFVREGRRVTPTAAGTQLIEQAQRMLVIHDTVVDRLTTPRFEGEITLGVPHDIVHPHIPAVLRQFSARYPRMQVRMTVKNTLELLREMRAGELDLVLTTEERPGPEGRVLLTEPLVWVGARDGTAHERDPLPIAFAATCAFRAPTIAALDAAGLRWFDAVFEASDDPGVVATAADLAVRAELVHHHSAALVPIAHRGRLPELPSVSIVRYVRPRGAHELLTELAEMIELAFAHNIRSNDPAVAA